MLPHLFDRFFRADEPRSRLSGGTGLGLSIVKAICDAHDVAITVRSVEGEGTLVPLEMPLALAGLVGGGSHISDASQEKSSHAER